MSEVEDPLERLVRWRDAGRATALATVVRTWGSSPRPVGSQLSINDRGEFAGSVSGGCVEAAVVEAAQEVMRSAVPRLVEFGVSDESAWAVGLSCGGQIAVFIESVE